MSFHVPDLTPHESNIVASTKPEAAFERLADQNQSKKDNFHGLLRCNVATWMLEADSTLK